MAKKEKLLARLKKRPKDFTWNELISMLKMLGYKQIKTGKSSGSRRRFVHLSLPAITLHKPHPSPHVKRYVLDDILEVFKKEGIV